jgi:hypothetical protein
LRTGSVKAKTAELILPITETTPVKNENGEAIGEFRYNGAVANKSLELLARILGMLVDKSEMTMKRDYSDLSDLELLQLLAKEARELESLEYQGR